MSSKKKNGLKDLATLVEKEIVEVVSVEVPEDFDWGMDQSDMELAIGDALMFRDTAFQMLNELKAENGHVAARIQSLKDLRGELDVLNNRIGNLKGEYWATFRKMEPAKAIIADRDNSEHEKVEQAIDKLIDESNEVKERNALMTKIDELQAEVTAHDEARQEAFSYFKKAEDAVKAVGLDPEELWPRKKNGGDDK